MRDGIEEFAGLDVADESVLRPAVPQTGNDIVELARTTIALVVVHRLVHAEVQRGIGVGRGDDVPCRATAADVVERGEAARDMKRRIEGGGAGGDQADMLGDHGERRQQGERLERRDGVAALQRVHRHVQHGEVVGHEERVEPAALQRLDEAFDVREVEVGVRVTARIAPGRGMDRGRPHEGAETELTFGGHDVVLPLAQGICPLEAFVPQMR